MGWEGVCIYAYVCGWTQNYTKHAPAEVPNLEPHDDVLADAIRVVPEEAHVESEEGPDGEDGDEVDQAVEAHYVAPPVQRKDEGEDVVGEEGEGDDAL